jgi:multisubunit Na+/H+ antiporter MnhB subunit
VDILLMIHSIVRWLIVIVGLIALVKFAIGWLRNGRFAGMDRGLSSGFSGLIDLQATLGLIFLLWSGLDGAGFPMFRIEHMTTMIIAAVVAHLPMRWKNAPDKVRFRNSFVVVLVTAVLIFVGVATLPGGGWSR